VFTQERSDSRDTVDVLAGITQVLNKKTLMTVNLTLSQASGYLADPYKIAEVNGVLIPENRPDDKDKQIVYVSLTRFIESMNASIEPAYRYYTDSFGIVAHTVSLAWYQRLGRQFILRPIFRYYDQDEADFYGVRFSGSPEFYSADYRLSSFRAYSGGIKLIWMPSETFAVDIAYDRYQQEGKDNETFDEVYPSANIITVGLRKWF
jgi:hypothetical protein